MKYITFEYLNRKIVFEKDFIHTIDYDANDLVLWVHFKGNKEAWVKYSPVPKQLADKIFSDFISD